MSDDRLTTYSCVQEKYGFKARTYQAAGFANVAEYKKVHGSDLFIRDIEEYDRICKVTLSLALQSLTMACLHPPYIFVIAVLVFMFQSRVHMLCSQLFLGI